MEEECIQKAINICPQLEDIFPDTIRELDFDKMALNDDGTWFKEYIWKDRSLIDVFLKDRGYCLTEYKFCNNIAPREIYCMEDVIHDSNMELAKLGNNHSFNQSKKINLLKQKIKCLECKNFTNSTRMEYMMHLLLKNFFNIEIESEKLNEFLKTTFKDLLSTVDYDFNKMDLELNKVNK